MATVAGPIAPQPRKSTSQSRRTSLMSNSNASFQTAPLAASVASGSRDSLTSQHTVGVLESRRAGPDVSSIMPPPTSYPTSPLPGPPTGKGKEKDAGPVGGLVSLPPPRLDLAQQTYYTPPSPPPSVGPTDEKSFDAYLDEREAIVVEAPAALYSEEQSNIIAFQESPQPAADIPTSTRQKRSGTLPTLPSTLPHQPPIELEYTDHAPYTQVIRPSEDGLSTSSATITLNPKAPSITLATPDAGLLHPPAPRPTRRNTTGSASRPSRNMVQAHAHMSLQPGGIGQPQQGFPTADDGSSGELDIDILKEAEQIRAERRAKAQQEIEQAMTAPKKSKAGSVDQDGPLVGNLIGEDHVNYVLMYNMLTGIRVAVSRCQAKIKRPLADTDYTASHKYSFDIIGNELTPSAKYDFKFKDYAPNVFRELREDHFQLDPSDYLVSLTAKYILSELGSPGKSGSFFYFSRDYRFIIKTLHHTEHKFLRRILKQYHDHMRTNPHSLLSRFYGLHRVKLPHGRKIHFVIMNNLFPPHRDIHETFDLKGSTVGREYPEERAAQNPRAVLKDLNWINRGRTLELGPEKRALLTEQLRRDTELLKQINVMDYSLLIGIHNMRRGNRDNLRRNTLKVFSPTVPPRHATSSQVKSRAEASAIRRAMRESDPKALGSHPAAELPDEDPEDNKQFIFYQDEGGFRSTDECNGDMDTIYYLGIIDICTPWTVLKRAENIWKGMKNDRHKISPVPAKEYGDRFVAFMKAIMRGGEGTDTFLEKPAVPERPKEE